MKPAFLPAALSLLPFVSFAQTVNAQPPTPVFPPVAPAPQVTPANPAVPPARPVPEPYPATEKPDYDFAQWEPASPFNFQKYDRPSLEHPINCIVIHDIEGPGMSAVRWFQNPKARVSSHYVVDADGKAYQLVKERDVAWHAGNGDINRRSVGIEHDGFAYRPGFYNAREYEGSARLVRDISRRYNIPRDRAHIFGHAEVPNPNDPTKFGGGSGHTDPGPYWDWDTFMALVRNDARIAPTAPPFHDEIPLDLPLNGQIFVMIRPGEKRTAYFSFTNTGDDPWLADTKPPRPNPELRQAGPVYLGNAGDVAPSGYGATDWISPRYAASPMNGDVLPGQVGTFAVPFTAPPVAGGQFNLNLRLSKVLPAPHVPIPFGPTRIVTYATVPWRIDAPLSASPPAGWSEKKLPDGQRVFWRPAARQAQIATPNAPQPDVLTWSAPLPIGGHWDVYVRVVPGNRKTSALSFEIPVADTSVHSARWNGKPTAENAIEPGWHKLGRYEFQAAPLINTPGVRPGDKEPAAPQAKGIVKLLPYPYFKDAAGGVLIAGDVRFVGPFAKDAKAP